MKKVRLDQLVFDQGLSESRERAKAIIMSGVVYVNGQRADKPGAQVAPDVKIEVRGNTLPYVSRGGFKLEKALKVFPVDPTGLTCIDCGASMSFSRTARGICSCSASVFLRYSR